MNKFNILYFKPSRVSPLGTSSRGTTSSTQSSTKPRLWSPKTATLTRCCSNDAAELLSSSEQPYTWVMVGTRSLAQHHCSWRLNSLDSRPWLQLLWLKGWRVCEGLFPHALLVLGLILHIHVIGRWLCWTGWIRVIQQVLNLTHNQWECCSLRYHVCGTLDILRYSDILIVGSHALPTEYRQICPYQLWEEMQKQHSVEFQGKIFQLRAYQWRTVQ